MKQILLIFLLLPLFVFSQTKPKTATQPKPKTGTTKPATAKKPAAATKNAPPKKPGAAVVKLVDSAYVLYRASKDEDCEKIIKKILVLDPRNKDAYMIRASIAMFRDNMPEMWSNLDKLYKFYPSEPEVYSNFAMTHLNYYFLSDSIKKVLCRKTIRLASRNAEGYSAMANLAATGGYYHEAMAYFDISFKKTWKDTLARVLQNFQYARCLYETGDTVGAVKRLDMLIPRVGAPDKYTCMLLRAKYKLDMGNTDVQNDIDTLNKYAPNQADIMILNAKFLNQTNRRDSACKMAKMVRMLQGGEVFDVSEFCDDIKRKVDINRYKTLTYSIGEDELIVQIDRYSASEIKFAWTRTSISNPAKRDRGQVTITKSALDSAYFQSNFFENESDVTLDKTITLWLSKAQFNDLADDSTTRISPTNAALGNYRLIGHEQADVFDENNREMLLDCMVLTDGKNKICYLNDRENPLIVKMQLEAFTMFLTKIE